MVSHPLFVTSASCNPLSGSAYTQSAPSSTFRCPTSANPTSGVPMETRDSVTPASRRSDLRVEYWRICSWQKGHPNDLVRTRSDVPPFPPPFPGGGGGGARRSDAIIVDPSRRYTGIEDDDSDARTSMVRASGEGEPENETAAAEAGGGEAQPQSGTSSSAPSSSSATRRAGDGVEARRCDDDDHRDDDGGDGGGDVDGAKKKASVEEEEATMMMMMMMRSSGARSPDGTSRFRAWWFAMATGCMLLYCDDRESTISTLW